MRRSKVLQLSRRRLLASAGAASAALAAPAVWTSASAQNRTLFVRDPGGPFTKGFGDAYYEPFRKETGIEVVGIVSGAEPTSQIKSMVDTKTYTWDIAGGISMTAAVQLRKEGDYIEKHGLDKDPVVQEIPSDYRDEYVIGSDVYTTALGYRKDTFKDKVPTSWNDYYDLAGFKGRRVMRKHPFDSVEIALMADGVTKDKVYPCDLDRAFRKMDQLKSNVSAWWTSGAQATQMLATGEADMLPVWANRIQAAIDQGAPVGIMWDANIWGLDVWAILKGGPKVEIAKEFIRFTCDAKRQAATTTVLTNGPTNPNAYKHIDTERAKVLSTYPAYRAGSVAINDAFWAGNKDKAIERFNDWVLK